MFRRPAPGSQPSTTPPRRKAGKSVALVVAFAVVLAAGLYVTLTMGGSRGNASPPPQPAARQAAAPAT